MDELGFSDNPYLVVRHYDKDDRERDSYAHIHIVASRVNDDGSLIDEWKNAEKVIAATKKIDREMNLESAEYFKNVEERNIKKNEYRVMQATGKLSVMEEFKDAANDVLKRIDAANRRQTNFNRDGKIEIFVEKIQEAGFEVLPNFDEEGGAMRGFSYEKDGIIFGSRAAGGKFKWENLAEKIGYEVANDYQFLVNLHAQTSAVIHAKEAKANSDSGQKASRNHNDPSDEIVGINVKDERILSLTHHESSVKVETEKEIFFAQAQYKNQIRETKANETTNKYSVVQSSVQSNERAITGLEKAENDSPESAVALAEKTRIEPVKSVEETRIDGRKSSESRDHRDDDTAVRSEETAVINAAENRRNRSDRTTATVAFAGSNSALDESIEGFEKSSRRDGDVAESTRAGNENHEEELIAGEQRLSKISEESRGIEAESRPGIDGEGDFNFGSGDRKKLNSGDGEYKSEETNFGTKYAGKELPNPDRRISSGTRKSDEQSEESREEVIELGTKSFDDLNRDGIDINRNWLDQLLQLVQYERRKRSTDRSNQRNTDDKREAGRREKLSISSEEFSEQSSGGNQDIIPGSQPVLQSISHQSNRIFEETANADPKPAEIAAHLINVKYFSAQLDEKIVSKWSEVIENSNAAEFLKELIEPKNSEETERLVTGITRQAELVAEGLNLTKPEPTLEPDPNILLMALTRIEVQNYEQSTGNEVNFLTLERIWNEKTAAFEESSDAEQNEKINSRTDESFGFSIFSTHLEMKTFQALLNPESVSFDENYILETEKSVERDNRAAQELATFVQIAYGGQSDLFTTQFKSALAEEIYYDSFSTMQLYGEFSDSNWRKTVERFAPVVNTLAEKEGILIPPPASVNEKNTLLAEYFTGRVAFLYEQNNGQINDQTGQNIFDSALTMSAYAVREKQKDQINLLTDESLEPLSFNDALEADIYIFDKLDESSQCQVAGNIVDFHYQNNQREVENNLESVNDEHQSNSLAM